MSPSSDPASLQPSYEDIVVRDFDATGAVGDWLRWALDCYPSPQRPYTCYVIEAINRIVSGIPWISQLLPGEFFSPIPDLLSAAKRLRRDMPQQYPVLNAEDLRKFSGDFLSASTLIHFGFSANPPRGIEALRAVLLACHWYWRDPQRGQISSIDYLASAIRAMDRGAIDPSVLLRMGQAKTLEDFLTASEPIAETSNRRLSSAWKVHVAPFLRARSAATQPPPRRRKPSPRITTETDTDGIGLPTLKVIRRNPPAPPEYEPPLVDELVEEVTPTILTTYLPKPPSNPDARAISRHYLQQAIWSRNALLTPNHPNVLLAEEYALTLRSLLTQLENPDTPPDQVEGALGLLIQALSGRSPARLPGIRLIPGAHAPPEPGRVDLLLAEGAFRLECFWQTDQDGNPTSHFRPTPEQEPLLEGWSSNFLLPLAPPVIAVVRAHWKSLTNLLSKDVDEISALLRLAAHEIGLSQGLEFTPGRLRASFSTHLFENCRDLAATQLICADSLGQSIAPLAYYAPERGRLAGHYWKFQSGFLYTDERLPKLPEADSRTGSHLIPRMQHVRAMTENLCRSAIRRNAATLVKQDIAVLHRHLVNQLAAMLIAGATHRPVNALFALTMGDILLERDQGGALFADKTLDGAHDPRLVVLPKIICRQIQAYLWHVDQLGQTHPDLAAHCRDVLTGRSPLLFAINEAGKPEALELVKWKAQMPDSWRALPWNWGRHWMRTQAVESGLRPELVGIQMGHLESVGYPFSDWSPTEPEGFIGQLADGWNELLKWQGWNVIHGLARPQTALDPPPLEHWAQRIRSHEQKTSQAGTRWRSAMRARLRHYRRQALEDALNHPEIVREGIRDTYLSASRDPTPHGLTREDLERIRDELCNSAGEDAALGIARANALCRIARVANRRTAQQGTTPGSIYIPNRPLDNAFVPGMMEAVRQIRALRDHVRAGGLTKLRSRWSDPIHAWACAALALALFGWCDDPTVVRGAIRKREKSLRSGVLEDTILVPFGDAPHESIALRGAAAIVMARLRWKHRRSPEPDWAAVEERLAELLPPWARGQSDAGLLERLCETVGVSNRYELSPAARKCSQTTGGSTPAHAIEQRALIDGDPVLDRAWETAEPAVASSPPPVAHSGRSANARAQYRALCAAFPDAARNTHLPYTQVEVASGDAASPAAYRALCEELRARLNESDPARCLQPVVHLLASWVLDMLVHGTAQRVRPALSTVKTYLTRVGGGLVHHFGQSSLDDVEDEELEEAYLAVIEAREESRPAAAAAALSLHAYAMANYGFPDIDVSRIRLWLSTATEPLADARLVLPTERDRMLASLRHRAEQPETDSTPEKVRQIWQASQVMTLVAQGGLRRSEALGLQFRDVSAHGNQLHACIRPNASRRLKTAASRRIFRLPKEVTSIAGLNLADWVQAERVRIASRRMETAYLFAALDAPSETTEMSAIAEVCVDACRVATGEQRSRLHALRHLRAMEYVTPVFLAQSDRDLLAQTLGKETVPTLRDPLPLPRDLTAQSLHLGHAGPSTTLRSYHHLPWLLRSHADARLAKAWGLRQVVAALGGVGTAALDSASNQRSGRNPWLAWLDVPMAPRSIPGPLEQNLAGAKTPPDTRKIEPHVQVSAAHLARVLDASARGTSLATSLTQHGLGWLRGERFEATLAEMERRLGRRLTAPGSGKSMRAIRPPASATVLDTLLKRYDEDAGGSRSRIVDLANEVVEYMRPRQQAQIHLPRPQMQALQDLLLDLGIVQDQIQVDCMSQGLSIMTVSAPDQNEADARNAIGWGLALKRVFVIVRLHAGL